MEMLRCVTKLAELHYLDPVATPLYPTHTPFQSSCWISDWQKPHTLTPLPVLWRSLISQSVCLWKPDVGPYAPRTVTMLAVSRCLSLSQVYSKEQTSTGSSTSHSTYKIKMVSRDRFCLEIGCRGNKEFWDQNLRGSGRVCCSLPVLLGKCFTDQILHVQATRVSNMFFEPKVDNASLYSI